MSLSGEVREKLPPLVVDLGQEKVAWIENGVGFTLSKHTGQWNDLSEADGLGGQVMFPAQVAELVQRFGRPGGDR